MVKRMSEPDRPLVNRMRDLAERPGLDPASRIAVRFGLGKAFDDLGDYAEAMRHYDAGNQLRAMSERLDRAGLAAQIDSTIALFSAEALEHSARSFPRPECPGDDMPVFVVGMVRSGTNAHRTDPVVPSGGRRRRRVEFLAQPCQRLANLDDRRPRGAHAGQGRRRLSRPAAQDRARGSAGDRQGARQSRAARAHRAGLPERPHHSLPPAPETRRLIAFCGLDWDEACLAPERNQRVVKTWSMWQARHPVYKTSVERWRRYELWLGELRELLPAAEAEAS